MFYGGPDHDEEYLIALEREDVLATPMEVTREFARNVGYEAAYINRQWILTDYDVWVQNPHYAGPSQRHPEEDHYPEDDLEILSEDAIIIEQGHDLQDWPF